jgi:thymidylate kinase
LVPALEPLYHAASPRRPIVGRAAVMKPRRLFSVALVGPDGVGKTTIAKRLVQASPFPARYLYLGPNFEAANYLLPITKWWVRRARRAAAAPATPGQAGSRGALWAFRGLLGGLHGVLQQAVDQAYRHLVARSFLRQGYLVVLDRHLWLDYQPTPEPGRRAPPLRKRARRALYRALSPVPDLVICLDAPPEVAWQRKRELSPALLEERRRQYRALDGKVKRFALVDASRDIEAVFGDVLRVVTEFDRSRGPLAASR